MNFIQGFFTNLSNTRKLFGRIFYLTSASVCAQEVKGIVK
jgi:hypothetical protein